MSSSQSWSSRLNEFKSSDNLRAVTEMVVTILPLAFLYWIMWKLLAINSWWAYLGFAATLVLAAGMLVRLFILQHDCGHGSFFKTKKMNDHVGRILGVFTYTPYEYWRYMHAAHHATSGDLERRGMGDIDTLTVDEYQSLPTLKKWLYRLYRHPVVLFVIGPFYMFVLRHRIPAGLYGQRSGWISTMGTNLGIAIVAFALITLFGLKTFLLIQIPLVTLAGAIGVWLFYVQHQFEDTYWDVKPDWTHENAALYGSSYYDLPRPLMWLTGYIGIHHVHHISSRIPFYRLPKILKAYPELKDISRLTFIESLKCTRLALWDDRSKQLITFKDFRSLLAQA